MTIVERLAGEGGVGRGVAPRVVVSGSSECWLNERGLRLGMQRSSWMSAGTFSAAGNPDRMHPNACPLPRNTNKKVTQIYLPPLIVHTYLCVSLCVALPVRVFVSLCIW